MREGLRPGVFRGTLQRLGERGCDIPGTLHRGQSTPTMGSLFGKPAEVFDLPVRLHLTGIYEPESVCVVAARKMRHARPCTCQVSQV
jgi:hypothetical protein